MTRVRVGLFAIGLALVSIVAAAAQGATPNPNPQPTCKGCPATYIPEDELDAYLKRAMANRIIDQQVRSVDIGKSNVAVGMVHRTRISTPGEVAEHDLVSEVYHVISGSATLVTGPEIEGMERRPGTNTNVRLLNGPGHNGKSIRNGVSHQLKAGDVIVIPGGTGHWFTKIDDHITYLMIRVDPDKATPLKDEAASKADLAGRK